MKLFKIIVALVVISSLPVFATGQQDEAAPMEKTVEKDMDKPMERTGPLVDFKSAESAMMLAESAPTVLFFHASWCSTCQSAEKEIRMNAADLEGINVIKVDYDNSQELQKKYGITSQHTFVQIDATGKALAKWNGGGSSEILKNITGKEM